MDSLDTGKTIKRNRGTERVMVFCLTTAVFLLLYRRFLFGNCVYLYSDIGSDSIAASYPILTQMSFLFQNKTFTFYTLSSGLGQETAATFLQFVNPLKFFMLFFDNDHMICAILLQLYLQTIVSGLAFYGYIRRFVRDGRSAVLAAMIWPFVSYTILWSQNLSYGTAVCMFTVSIYLIENILDRQTLKNFLLLSLALAVFIASNYYFVYMTAVFTVVYIVIRALFLKKGFREFLKGFFATALSAVFAVMLSAAAVVCIVSNFGNSARTDDIHSILDYIPGVIRPSFAYTAFARLFSENMLGTANEYSGPTNYYEVAELFVSALFLFAFFYFLQEQRKRGKLIILTILAAASIMLPLFRYVLDQSALCMRFSFMLCFLECLLTGLFLDELFTEMNPVRMKRAGIVTACFTAGSYVLLYALQGKFGASLNPRALVFSALTTAACLALLFLVRKKRIPGKTVPFLIGLFLAGEILIMHHDSLYLRLYLTKESYATQFYNTGTAEAAFDVQANDDGLYRISATENPDLSNDGEVNHYNGTTLRNNTNPQSLIDLTRAFGTNERYEPYFLSGYPQYFQFTLLSGKYIFKEETSSHRNYTENTLFQKKGTYDTPTEGVSKAVYENVNALPFGYLYEKQISAKDYEGLDLPDKMYALTESWFDSDSFTERSSGAKPDDSQDATTLTDEELQALSGDDTREDLLREAKFRDPHNLETSVDADGLHLVKKGEDPYCYVDLPAGVLKEEGAAQYLYIRASGKKGKSFQIQLYYLDRDNRDANPTWYTTLTFDDTYPESFILLPEGITGFRLDFDYSAKQTLETMELITCTHPESHFSELKSTVVTDISFSNDVYTATVTSGSDDGMFCVPLLYSKNWSATVNGKSAEIRNINGGFIGIPVASGTSEIRLRYSIPHFKAGIYVSLFSMVLYIILAAYAIVRGRKKSESPAG